MLRDTGNIRQLIADTVPGYEQIREIATTKEEFQIGGRTFYEPSFPTESGKASIRVAELPELPGNRQELRLMTVRSEGQFNTVVYEEHDLYRGQEARDVILVHPEDIESLGLQGTERVTVRSQTGAMENILIRPFKNIRPGNALMYYPEANELVPRTVDPASKTPAFKGFAVSLQSEAEVA